MCTEPGGQAKQQRSCGGQNPRPWGSSGLAGRVGLETKGRHEGFHPCEMGSHWF